MRGKLRILDIIWDEKSVITAKAEDNKRKRKRETQQIDSRLELRGQRLGRRCLVWHIRMPAPKPARISQEINSTDLFTICAPPRNPCQTAHLQSANCHCTEIICTSTMAGANSH